MSFLFAKCRPTHPRCCAARAGTVVWPIAAGGGAVAVMLRILH